MNKQSNFNADTLKAMLVNGSWQDGSGGTFEVRNPHDGSLLHEVGRAAASDVETAVAAARAAQPGWAALSTIERAQIMRRIHQLFLERAEPIAQMITAEIGKTINDAREEVFEYSAPSWAKSAEEILRHRGLSFPSTQERTRNKRLVMNHRPLGVVAVITPYNFPTDISSIALAHIAAAGNTVIWKPSEYAAVSCAMMGDIFRDAGLPDGVINIVQGKGDVGAALVDHDDVDGVFFTGSTATGRKIAEKCALRPHLLELGGDGPFIIMADADIDAAVDGAMNGCFYYSGQVCTSAERLLVHEDVYDEFLEKFLARAAKLKIGDPSSEESEMGPLCNSDTLKRVKSHVEDACAKGAKIEQFGNEEGLYFPATILTDVTLDMDIMREETFGPVAPIYKFKDNQEVIDIAHLSGLGLIASLWTRDLATAWRVGEALPHGTVNINETSNYWDQLAPFGGTGQSGVGRELSQWFLETFTEKKLLVFDLGGESYNRRAEGGW
ncbi:aldehyde dehydrogenase family protein [Aliiroseovarius subalbicans]|uniref:aldehyde dehydrogenase family protein n=1 Tax=Aliiroseovarius subalbicans TaxID=2925840 RepID=UPI001F59991C|nr:aldehyde dehydrogenase family protein [uncultured Aliiroseovarius sp.]MCI2400926.1 aldehyde dehydrogenase family protein [Aliiroseovarius subalbicans]